MASVTLHEGDNRESLRRLFDQGVRVHSVVTDPPYGLVSVQKRFGKEGSKPARTEKNDGSFARLSGGFMGKTWDGSGIERDPEFWSLVYDILLPGGYVFAFSGSRTGHWQACAMELAGFIMHPMHGWCFGSGFPKPTVVRNVEGFEGWGYGTQAQKPALEPIYLGQKPFSEKTGPANLLKHGVGAVDIDGCRVPAVGRPLRVGDYKTTANNTYEGRIDGTVMGGSRAVGSTDLGRHPANLILDGSPEVVAMFPAKAGAAAPASGPTQSGKSKSGSMAGHFNGMDDRPPAFHADAGSAARFFHQFPRYACETCQDAGTLGYEWVEHMPVGDAPCPDCGGYSEMPPDADPLIYHPKAGKLDRAGSGHPTVKPIALMQYLIRHITPPGGTVLDMFAGSGTTAEAALREGRDCILMEAEPEYIDFLRQRFPLPAAATQIDDLMWIQIA